MGNPTVLPGEEFLNDFYIDEELRVVLNPQLFFNEVLPNTDTTERSVIYDAIKNTAADDLEDGVMTLPMPSGEEAALTKLQMRNISELKAKIPKIGYEFDMSQDVLNSKARTLSDLNLKLKSAAYGMSYAANKLTLDTLKKGAKTLAYNPAVQWGATTGTPTPIKDIIGAYYDYIDYGYPNRAMNWFMHFNNHKELVQYLVDYDIDFQFVNKQSIEIIGNAALKGLLFTNVNDQYDEGSYLTMDLDPSVHPGAETYRYIEPGHAVEQPKADPNEETQYTGIHVNITKMDKNPFTTTVEVWFNYLPIVKIDNVIGKGSGI